MIANVLVEISKIDKTFYYKIPENKDIFIGQRVLVPFGNRLIEGFVVELKEETNITFELKEIADIVDSYPLLNSELLKLGHYMNKKLICSLISCYQTMLPSALKANVKNKTSIKKIIIIKEGENFNSYTPQNEKEKNILFLATKYKAKSEANKISVHITKRLLDNKVIIQQENEIYRIDDSEFKQEVDFPLTEEQQRVIALVAPKYGAYLLHGVTGSGKTEVYIQLIKKAIASSKTALILLPEISLTPQFIERFKKRFGTKIATFHSKLSPGEKYDEWRRINKGEVSIVIGARSAIFAPLKNIGIIILDEEHSQTYKQDNKPFYNTIDIAIRRAKYHGCPVILGSATPSLESYTRTKLGYYDLLKMPNRINNMLPIIKLVDMKNEFKKGNKIFSELLKDKIEEKLSLNEQIIILLNRRGYKTVINCPNCGFVHKCPSCDIPLTYHLGKNRMLCHYCNREEFKKYKCACGEVLKDSGMGTEMLEEEIIKTFEKARVIRMDYDTTTTKSAHKKIIKEFEEGKYNILVGTQMIAKGLDFPNVTLVGVINGDSTLQTPDYKSAERTFQLLYQVAGRAGRKEKLGEVVIQCFNVDHYSLFNIKNYDYENFYNEEMKIRKLLKYPPFYNVAMIKIQSENESYCVSESEKIADYIRENTRNVMVLGPSVSLMPRINKIYNYQIILKYKNTSDVYDSLVFIDKLYLNKKIKVSINFNY